MNHSQKNVGRLLLIFALLTMGLTAQAHPDWTTPFLSLADDGSGTFTGSAALADGSYPYMFRVHGAADHLVRDGMYFNDQTNPSFVPSPPQAPVMRSVSQLVVPRLPSQ